MNGATCVNFASGGLTTKTWLTADRGLPLVKATAAQQLYLIALGINDVNTLGTSYLGTISDITPTYANNPDTFYGNMARIIEQIKEYAPNAKIILSTMATNTGDFLTYNQAIIAIANHYGIAYIEQYNDTFFTGSFYKDNLISGHPTAPVYVGMAKAFMRLINKCMQNNLNYFKDYLG
jgi:lysophospholipase L1-like esterase